MSQARARSWILLAAVVVAAPAIGQERGRDRRASALVGGRVLLAPGRVADPGVVVIRGGVIEGAGPAASIRVPEDARVFDVKGLVVHAAFIDPHAPADRLAGRKLPVPIDDEAAEERKETPPRRARGAAEHEVTDVRADERTVDSLEIRERVAETYRRLGFAVVAVSPVSGVLRGEASVVSLAEGPITGRVLVADAGQVVSLEPDRAERPESEAGVRPPYPSSRMGATALVRQCFRDALWWRDAEAAYARNPATKTRPQYWPEIAALVRAAEGKAPVVFEAADVLALLRGARVAQELKLRARYVGAGDEYRLRAQVAALQPDLVLRVDFPRPDRLENADEWLDVPLSRLRAIDRAPSNPRWLKDAGLTFSFTTSGLRDVEQFDDRVREAVARGLSREDALAAVTIVPARQLGLDAVLGTLDAGKTANVVVARGEPFTVAHRIRDMWIDGLRLEMPEAEKKDADATPTPAPKELPEDVRAFPVPDWSPLATPPAVLVRGATVWTQAGAGVLEGADVVAVGGKVTAVGKSLAAPAGATVVDARGKHVTPGIIDAHSHTAVDGPVNEMGDNVNAEVRIRDVINPFDVSMYQQLAGGTTTANVLHGSANSIGGQNAILKWRLGGGPEDLFVAGAPEGIKFALGENPKRSPVGRGRYPATRMGVASLIRDRFLAARDYRRRHAEYRTGGRARGEIPPRTDLQLEAIAEVLEGTRKVHCHSYRKDEILQMLRVAEEFGVKVATLQHVLEGYKVADEIARHGAGASCFSDWWAYKFEVYDAIPHAGALMRERGVLVTFNSDSNELARRLNLEAAKAVKYGGLAPADALAFVTSNAAGQLGIDARTGSLEPGKDADFVLWTGDPLSSSSTVLETWIEGKKYFDRAHDLSRRADLEKERADLVAAAKRLLDRDKKASAKPDAAEPLPTPAPPGGRS